MVGQPGRREAIHVSLVLLPRPRRHRGRAVERRAVARVYGRRARAHDHIQREILGKDRQLVARDDATERLHTGDLVTVDGARGTVTAGAGARVAYVTPRAGATTAPAAAEPVTATKLYVNLALAERADEIAAMDVDGVGLVGRVVLAT